MFGYQIQEAAKPAQKPSVVNDLPSISIVGLGYVGVVSTACLSGLGHRVIGVDVDPNKVAKIAAGKAPIHEKDLGHLLDDGVSQGRVTTTTQLALAVKNTDVTFVSVGTPSSPTGDCDYSCIKSAAVAIGEGLKLKSEYHVIVMRCSVPPGTTLGVFTPIIEQVSGLTAGKDFGICFNPEFLREGAAVADFLSPSKTVFGVSDPHAARILARIFKPVARNPIITSIETAEMVKYVDNVWHANKVCFANEIGRICKPLHIDSHDVMDIFVQDTKLNLSPYYLKPGFAYGGSCLPKEVRAVAHLARENHVHVPLIESLSESNSTHISQVIQMLRATGAKRVGILGLAFKPGTDDLRESPVLRIMDTLLNDGIKITGHDMAITGERQIEAQLDIICKQHQNLANIKSELPKMLTTNLNELIDNVDAVLICHKSHSYRRALKGKTTLQLVDVVRLFDEDRTEETYNGIGW